ncbi:MAG: aconitate hydratase AcnA [Burkholderiales bacterium]
MSVIPIPTRDLPGGLRMVDLGAAMRERGIAMHAMPFVVRVLAENVLRAHLLRGPEAVSAREVASILDWRAHTGHDLPLFVSRVILPDSSGIPVLQDLAALREAVAARGGDPRRVDTLVPLDFVVDHSLQVDRAGTPDAIAFNMTRELARNAERYAFLRWCQSHFDGIALYPPGSGIIHQVNLERAARVVCTAQADGLTWAYPDFVIGGDSHTPMVNALGVLGWGVGGIDAEAALLDLAYVFPIPEVVGVRLTGTRPPGVFMTDIALLVTRRLREARVVDCAVEYFGDSVARMSIPDRATLANMAPEYGATCGFFAIDETTLAYLRATGRDAAHVGLVEAYAKAAGLFRDAGAPVPQYARVIDIDLAQARPTVAGPSRPQETMRIPEVAPDFRARLDKPLSQGGFARPSAGDGDGAGVPPHGRIAIAAITSCTNTSNPSVMIAAGLVARNCVRLGVAPPAWVKTSLAPGSQSVTRYLEAAGLMAPLRALGFDVVGYGCTTCGGKSGPLEPGLAATIERDGVVAAAVLSGNRNFPGRIHKLVQANYLMAPPLVVAYAVAGRVDFEPDREPLARNGEGRDVYLRDVLPGDDEVAALVATVDDPAHYAPAAPIGPYDADYWTADRTTPGATPGATFAWDPASTYLVRPPFFDADGEAEGDGIASLARALERARVLVMLGDAATTDHISPSGEIPADTPSGRYLLAQGVAQKDFNTYVGRRGNHHVMVRGTFANVRLRNRLTPDLEGGFTRVFPEGDVATVFDAAARYRERGESAIVLAGTDYGTGSSRDWAAKGTALLGIRAVIAGSFERIHRANLIGMGVLPLAFEASQDIASLGLSGSESYRFEGVEDGVLKGAPIRVIATGARTVTFSVIAQVFTESQRRLIAEGGMPRLVTKRFASSI